VNSTNVDQVVATMRKRSSRIRIFAQLLILVIVIVVGVTMAFFFTSSQYMPNTDSGRRLAISFLGFQLNSEDTYRGSSSAGTTKESETDEVRKLREENSKLQGEAKQSALAINTLGSAILRIGSVVLAVYLIQVLVHLTRYNFRIADHIDSLADLLLLTEGDFEKISPLVETFTSKHIAFGPQPVSVSEKLTEAITEAVKKIGSKQSAQ